MDNKSLSKKTTEHGIALLFFLSVFFANRIKKFFLSMQINSTVSQILVRKKNAWLIVHIAGSVVAKTNSKLSKMKRSHLDLYELMFTTV